MLHNGQSGEVYNVCSGLGVKLCDVVKMIADIVGITIETVVNPKYVRPNDNKQIIGSFEKIRKNLGWQPEIDLKTTLNEMVCYVGES